MGTDAPAVGHRVGEVVEIAAGKYGGRFGRVYRIADGLAAVDLWYGPWQVGLVPLADLSRTSHPSDPEPEIEAWLRETGLGRRTAERIDTWFRSATDAEKT